MKVEDGDLSGLVVLAKELRACVETLLITAQITVGPSACRPALWERWPEWRGELIYRASVPSAPLGWPQPHAIPADYWPAHCAVSNSCLEVYTFKLVPV